MLLGEPELEFKFATFLAATVFLQLQTDTHSTTGSTILGPTRKYPASDETTVLCFFSFFPPYVFNFKLSHKSARIRKNGTLDGSD
jgi:hypothetical protein